MAIVDTNSTIRAYLATQTALTTLVGVRIYCPRLPENVELPAVSFFTRGGTSTPYIPGIPSPSVQFDCWADNPIDAREVYRALYDSLQGIQNQYVTGTVPVRWVSPTSFADSGGVWTDQTLAYDDDTATMAYTGAFNYLELLHNAIFCGRIRIWCAFYNGVAEQNPDIDIDVYYSSAWHNIQSGVVTSGQYVTVAIPVGIRNITKARVICNNAFALGTQFRVYEFDFESAPYIMSAIEEVQGQDLVDTEIPSYFRVLTFFSVMIRAE